MGKMMGQASKGAGAEASQKAANLYDLYEGSRMSKEGIPHAPRSAFRKRPVKI